MSGGQDEILYGEDRRRAWDVAQSEPDGDACDKIVDAIFATIDTTKAHSVEVKGGNVEITYNNGFGPTVAVDDVIERMTVAGWKKVCCETMRRLLLKCGRGDLVQRSLRAKAYPTVTLVPEDGTPIIATVKLSMWMPKRVREAFEWCERKAAEAMARRTRSPGPLQGEIVPHDPSNIGGC